MRETIQQQVNKTKRTISPCKKKANLISLFDEKYLTSRFLAIFIISDESNLLIKTVNMVRHSNYCTKLIF